jgi:aryl sulfotransferase
MTSPARILSPAARSYSGGVLRPDRWQTWVPRAGDILVCTPPKCGTTWTQTILAMLVHGGADLPQKVPVLSPWVDADVGVPADEVAAALAAQTGRRVVKTHAPADGFPIWDGVTVIAVYRHPLDLLFSMRKHTANQTNPDPDEPSGWPLARSIRAFITDPTAHDAMAKVNLANVAMHYRETALSGRLPDLKLFHYANMIRDGRRTVQALALAAGINADDGLIDRVTAATAFGAMKARAADYAPVAGTGFWKSDSNFFDSASSGKWEGQLSAYDLGLYRERLAALIPDPAARTWIEQGDG